MSEQEEIVKCVKTIEELIKLNNYSPKIFLQAMASIIVGYFVDVSNRKELKSYLKYILNGYPKKDSGD